MKINIKIKIMFLVLLIGLSVPAITLGGVATAQIESNICGGAEISLAEGKCARMEGGKCVVSKAGGGTDEVAAARCNSNDKVNNLIKNIVNLLSLITGIAAVVMIVVSGFKYITSGGDSGRVTSAKTTIIYAIVGLIIVALAQFIVRFVLGKAVGSPGSTT